MSYTEWAERYYPAFWYAYRAFKHDVLKTHEFADWFANVHRYPEITLIPDAFQEWENSR